MSDLSVAFSSLFVIFAKKIEDEESQTEKEFRTALPLRP